jgi:TolA-binding protein
MSTSMKSKFLNLILVLVLFVSNQYSAQANTQSVCINKKTGEIRVSKTCKSDESKATRKITSPKLSKTEQLKKKITDLESQIVSIEEERNKLFENILKFSPSETSLDAYMESCRSAQWQPEKCATSNGIGELVGTLDKQLYAVNKALNRYKREAGIYRTIICKKGSETLTITDEKPKCPKGYK